MTSPAPSQSGAVTEARMVGECLAIRGTSVNRLERSVIDGRSIRSPADDRCLAAQRYSLTKAE